MQSGPVAPFHPTDALIGRTLDGRYRIEKLLGEGGMGIVYKAVHTTLGKPLAIKVLRAEVSKNEEILQRFRQEAQSASQVGNPHIIDISDFGTLADGSTYFVMEFLTGKSLTAALGDNGGRFDTQRTVRVMRQLASALGAAHEVGVVHRDLKPDNVQLIERGGQKDFVKILDFGIAKVGGSTSKLTQAGQVFGTPHYMSPEQCAGAHVDHRTDIYAAGVMLYEMVSGRVPFEAETLMGILTKHLYEAPAAPSTLSDGVAIAPPLEAIILKCLQKKPDARYQTMAELEQDLEALERGAMPRAVAAAPPIERPPTGPQTLTGVEARVARTADDVDFTVKKRKTPLFVGLGVCVALAGAGSAYWFGRSNSAHSVPPTKQAVAAAANPVTAPNGPGASAVQAPPTAAVEAKLPAEPEPVAAQPAAPLTVTSQPTNADVYVAGALVGTTPYAAPKPERGKHVTLELRSNGYQAKSIELTDASDDIQVTLQKLAARPSTAARPTKRAHSDSGAVKQPAPSGKRTAPQAEVLDPWI
jgi:serine/threonine-protein kinase